MTKPSLFAHPFTKKHWRSALGFARYLWSRFSEDRCVRTAEALTYLSLFAVVPLLTVMFAIFSVIPAFASVGGEVQAFVFSHFLPSSGQEIQAHLLQFSAQARNLTGIGIAFLIATALLMLTRIEEEFNTIWRVRSRRTSISHFVRYWAILTLGPLCIGIAIGISTYLASLHVFFEEVDIFGVHKFFFVVTPYLLTTTAFTLLFAIIPNCRVPLAHALLGGAVSALCFEIAKYAFARVAANASYELIYGTFAAIPLFLLWIYISWMIVLAGAELVHAIGNYGDRDSRLPDWLAALCILEVLWRRHRRGEALHESELLQRQFLLGRYTLSAEHWAQLRDRLLHTDLIAADADGHYRLARALQEYTLWQLCEDFVALPAPLDTFMSETRPWLLECAHRFTHLRDSERRQLRIPLEALFALADKSAHPHP